MFFFKTSFHINFSLLYFSSCLCHSLTTQLFVVFTKDPIATLFQSRFSRETESITLSIYLSNLSRYIAISLERDREREREGEMYKRRFALGISSDGYGGWEIPWSTLFKQRIIKPVVQFSPSPKNQWYKSGNAKTHKPEALKSMAGEMDVPAQEESKKSHFFCHFCSIWVPSVLDDASLVASVQFSRSVVSDSLWPHGLRYAGFPCPSPTPRAYSNSCPSSRWCHPTISSTVVPFSSCLQSFPASGSFPKSQFFTWGGQSIRVSASASVLPMNIQDSFPLGFTGWISLQSKGLSRFFSNAMVKKDQFFSALLSL